MATTHPRKVIHVELKEPYKGRRNYYFGSAAAIYDTLPIEIVGISLATLWNRFCGADTYHGALATIRKRELLTKSTNRGKRNENRADNRTEPTTH
jgi:hypothetical protein